LAGQRRRPLQSSSQQAEQSLDADFRGFGRTGSDFTDGIYRFETIKQAHYQ
jgi:protocatechuate 3,4-dioxygenase beta subunit